MSKIHWFTMLAVFLCLSFLSSLLCSLSHMGDNLSMRLFSRFPFLRNVERPSSGKNRSIYFSNCHWPTQAPSIIWPNKKPFNEMRENLGNHKSKTARIIYLGAMIYLRRIYDMFHAMKSNFLKPFFCALYISFNNLQVKTAWNRHIWKTWTLISKEGDNHLPIKIHISPLLFFLTFYWQR